MMDNQNIPQWCIRNYDDFAIECCNQCTAIPDGYCPTECDVLAKGRNMPFEKILKKYIQYEGDLAKVFRYIRGAKV